MLQWHRFSPVTDFAKAERINASFFPSLAFAQIPLKCCEGLSVNGEKKCCSAMLSITKGGNATIYLRKKKQLILFFVQHFGFS